MRSKKAKKIRKIVYGKLDFRERNYYTGIDKTNLNRIVADDLRSLYQRTKKGDR